MYDAIINTPGYLPEGDILSFDTAREAWAYLADELRRQEDELIPGDSYSDTVLTLEAKAGATTADGSPYEQQGTVYGPTPGYDGEHDLGVAYTVSYHAHQGVAGMMYVHYEDLDTVAAVREVECEGCDMIYRNGEWINQD